MCECEASLVTEEGDPIQIEESPSGVTWLYYGGIGKFAVVNDDGSLDDKANTAFGGGFEEVKELVAPDDEHLWYVGLGGIQRVPVEDLDGSIELDSSESTYLYHEGDVDDFDIGGGWCWWIEDEVLYRMETTDFGGTPESVRDFSSVFDSSFLQVAVGENRVWVAPFNEQDPSVYVYDYDDNEIAVIELTSEGQATIADITIERNTGMAVVAPRSISSTAVPTLDTSLHVISPLRLKENGTICRVDTGQIVLNAFDAFVKSVGHGAERGFTIVLTNDLQ